MTAHDLAHSLMSRPRRNGPGWLVLCPVHGDKHPSLSLKDGDNGKLLVRCFAGCEAREILKTLRDMGLLDGESSPVRPTPEPPKDDTERRIDRAEAIWNESAPIKEGDPVHRYLAGRGITLPRYPEDLQCHSSLDYWEVSDAGKPVKTGTFPAMLAVVRSPQGRPVALLRTYLTEDGKKAPVDPVKKAYGVHPMQGGAVRLFPPKEGFLAVAEGVEDSLSAMILWGIPTWACLGTSGMRTFQPPERVQELMIFADRDENGAGQKAALALAQRLEDKGMAVRIRVPSGQKDLNQLLVKGIAR